MALYQQMECMCLSAPLSFGDVQSATMARFIEIILMALGRFSPGQLGADLTAVMAVSTLPTARTWHSRRPDDSGRMAHARR